MGKSKILITGGAGFIGSHLADRLLNEGFEVSVIDDFNDYYDRHFKEENTAPNLKNKNYHLFRGDIADSNFLKNVFHGNTFDKIIHLAARAGVRPSIQDPALYMKVNVTGTLNLLEMAKQKEIKDFIFASSSSVYGNQTKIPFSEADGAVRQVSPYGASKRSGELLIHSYHALCGLNTVCLRFFTVYGERGRPDMAPYLFTESLLKRGEIKKFGDGETLRDYTYVEDIVDGIIKCLDKDFGYEIINLGNNKPVSLNNFIETLELITGRKATIIAMPEQPGDVKVTYADVSKAKKLLGWEPKVGFKEGLTKFVKWYQTNRA